MNETAQIIQPTGWLGQPMLEVAGSALTPFMVMRTVLIIALTVLLVRMVRRALDDAGRDKPEMTRGSVWLFGKLAKWAIIVIGAFFALSSLGLDLTRATLIMSALTVGIGFGLQNIVNNFVSGVILMFERSVRVGDWIVVGSTEGIVKQINIRSTVVSRFDRAEVIVPNSDLISGQVTNWTLLDEVGRIVIELEVEIGAKPEKVCAVLHDVATSNPDVCDGPDPAGPVVRVTDVGDRGLRYRMQCFVQDVGQRSRVRGDLLLATVAEFERMDIKFALRNGTDKAPIDESSPN